MPRVVRLGLVALGGVVAVFVLLSAAHAVSMARASGEVVPRVSVAGVDVGGLSGSTLEKAIGEVAERYEGGTVVVDAPQGGFRTTTDELGVRVDVAATAAAARRVGRTGSFPGRVLGWVTSLVGGRESDVVVAVDRARTYEVVARKDRKRTPAVEPGLALKDGKLVAVPGKAGRGIDPADVVEEVRDAAGEGVPIRVEVSRGTVSPRFTIADAEKLIGEARARIDEPVTVEAGTTSADVPAPTLRSWLTSRLEGDRLVLAFDRDRTAAGLAELLPTAGTRPVETTFRVAGSGVELVPGKAGTACCDPEAAAVLDRSVLGDDDGPDEPVELPLEEVEPRRTVEEARALGIKELVASYTTKHPCCQPRVTNIHRIADLVRGQIIEPGQTFSVNDFVGRRTVEKGFVVDKVIEEGRFAESVGGGISQFATTLFNAAFFAGLEIPEYQSHSIYISRYPYGREATLSFPKPDLRIRNDSPYGVLIWPTYTSTGITVGLYSTKWAEVTQSGQTKEQRGQSCTRVRTERTIRHLADGKIEKDHVGALYRGAEGLSCDQPLSAATTTTRPGTATTRPPASSTTTARPQPAPSTTTTTGPPR